MSSPAPKGLAKKLGRAALGLFIVFGAGLGVFSLFAGTRHYPLTGVAHQSSQLRGAYHVHTTASDGRGDLADVADAAKRAGLSFVVVTDHNLKTLPEPRYLDGVLIVPGVEESTHWGHLVALGSSRPLTPSERLRRPVDTVHELGGMAVLAHPVQPRNPWKDWDAGARADGFELVSGDTLLREAMRSPGRLFCSAGAYFANPAHGLMLLNRPQPDGEAKLLALSGAEPKVALCSVDAHGLPPYRTEFETLSVYLPAEVVRLPEDPAAAAKLVLQALAEGRTYCSFDALGEGAGFALLGLSGPREGRVGDRLRVVLPPTGNARARVVVAGAAILDADAGTLLLDRPGPALVQVQLEGPDCTTGEEWRPWIVTSPLMVRQADGGS